MRFRILPLTIMSLFALLAAKSFDLVVLEDSYASVAPKTVTKELAKAEPASGAPAEPKEGECKKEEPKNYSEVKPQEKLPGFSESEKMVLEKLANRREELDKEAKELEMKSQLIDASSKKLDEKLVELKKLQSDTQALLDSYNQKENAKISSLVKIYEGMKPKDAAAVFEEMDMDILLQIINKMSERKSSPIIAALSPKKAKNVTERIAREKTLGQVASATP